MVMPIIIFIFLGSPKINDSDISCYGTNKEKCLNKVGVYGPYSTFQIKVTFTGVGPFMVTWYFNDSVELERSDILNTSVSVILLSIIKGAEVSNALLTLKSIN